MIKQAIEKILELAPVQQFSILGSKWTDKQLCLIRDPIPAALRINTLSGIVDYLTANIDCIDPKTIMIHVTDYDDVSVIGGLTLNSLSRPVYVEAKSEPCKFRFGDFYPLENFIVSLQSNFVPSDDVARILSIVGNIKDENVNQYTDDGVTQTVVAKTGVARVGEVNVPGRVRLAPYRTFAEADQPASEFVFRMQSGKNGEPPRAALFESDGGTWKLEAIKKIKGWIAWRLPDIPIIA